MFKEWKKIVCKPLKIIDMFTGILVIGTTLFLIFYWKYIPKQVPQHWNFAGEIDDYADAGSYIMLVIMMYFFYIAHTLTKLIPMFDWKENLFGKERANKISKDVAYQAINTLYAMLWICDLLIQIMCAYIILCGVFVRNLGAWFLPITLGLMVVDLVWFLIRIMSIKGKVR